MRDPRALAEWANLDDFGLQLPPDLVPISDPLVDLGIQLSRSLTEAKAEAQVDPATPAPAKTDVAA